MLNANSELVSMDVCLILYLRVLAIDHRNDLSMIIVYSSHNIMLDINIRWNLNATVVILIVLLVIVNQK